MKKSIKFICLLLAILVTSSMLGGCGTKDSSNSNTPKKDSLIIATQNEPPSLTTCDHDSVSSVFMNLLTYNGLMRITQDTLKAVPDLAESYTVENDVDWYFKLKKDVLFHDGSKLTSADVVASLEWAKTFPASSNYTKNIAKVEAIDEYTVKITTDGPYAGLLYDLGYHFNFIVPKALIDSGNDFNKNPIGTGPYKFKSWSRGDSITFVKNDNYFDKEKMPTITNLTWQIIPESTSRTIALEAGEVDFVYEVGTTDITRLQENKDIELAKVTSVVNWFLGINEDVAPYNDVNLRKAINSAIDRDAIVSAALDGYGVPNISAVPQGLLGATEENAEGFDLEKAKKYLAAWGGDVSTLKLPIVCSNETKVKVATIIQSNLEKIGIKVEVVTTDLATYLDLYAKGDYVSAIISWSPSNVLTYTQRFHSRRRVSNPGSLNSPEVDALVVKAETTIDDAARLEYIHKIIAEVNNLCPQPSLYQDVIYRAYSAKLGGVVPSATGYVNFNEVFWK